MAKRAIGSPELLRKLQNAALQYPEAEAGTSCNKVAIKAKGKSFLFLGSADNVLTVMLKLGPSLPEAAKLATESPDGCQVGPTGWVTLTVPDGQAAPAELVRWIDESFRLLAPKRVVAKLASGSSEKECKRGSR